MTDLEITRLCALAMGYHPAAALSIDGSGWFVLTAPDKTMPVNAQPHTVYDPLHHYAQAMALVEKCNIGWDKEEGHAWHIALCAAELIFNAHNDDLKRTICECVAKMQLAKGAPERP